MTPIYDQIGFFLEKIFPEVNLSQISREVGYLYVLPISRNLLYGSGFEFACTRSIPKSRKKSAPPKKVTLFYISEQISVSDPNRLIPMVHLCYGSKLFFIWKDSARKCFHTVPSKLQKHLFLPPGYHFGCVNNNNSTSKSIWAQKVIMQDTYTLDLHSVKV